jgi:S-adenosylmethionine/arginine decarboxylase-like enzyme
MCNRVLKSTNIGTAVLPANQDNYNLDATGNVLAVIKRVVTNATPAQSWLTITELNIYGSSRLGISNPKTSTTVILLNSSLSTHTYPSAATFYDANLYLSRKLGEKSYEISDHLGNTRNIISDVRRSVKNTIGSVIT